MTSEFAPSFPLQPERREGKERMSYEPETNAPSSPFHPSGNRTVLLTLSELVLFIDTAKQQSRSLIMVQGHMIVCIIILT